MAVTAIAATRQQHDGVARPSLQFVRIHSDINIASLASSGSRIHLPCSFCVLGRFAMRILPILSIEPYNPMIKRPCNLYSNAEKQMPKRGSLVPNLQEQHQDRNLSLIYTTPFQHSRRLNQSNDVAAVRDSRTSTTRQHGSEQWQALESYMVSRQVVAPTTRNIP